MKIITTVNKGTYIKNSIIMMAVCRRHIHCSECRFTLQCDGLSAPEITKEMLDNLNHEEAAWLVERLEKNNYKFRLIASSIR